MSKHLPETREEFKEICLRRLGHPVIKINISDDQVEDCVEEALKYYYDYHFDGSEHAYITHIITEQDKTNRFIPVDDKVIGITNIYSLSTDAFNTYVTNMWTGGWQMALDFAFNISSGSIVTYYMNNMYYEFLNQILVGIVGLRFNRKTNRLYIDYDWSRWNVGDRIIIDARVKTDPEEHPEVWQDRWLIRYTAAKIKQIWGSNLSKFTDVQLPSGVSFNGDKIYDDATNEIQMLEDEMILSYSLPPRDQVG